MVAYISVSCLLTLKSVYRHHLLPALKCTKLLFFLPALKYIYRTFFWPPFCFCSRALKVRGPSPEPSLVSQQLLVRAGLQLQAAFVCGLRLQGWYLLLGGAELRDSQQELRQQDPRVCFKHCVFMLFVLLFVFGFVLPPLIKMPSCRATMLDSETESLGTSHQSLLEEPSVQPQSIEGQFMLCVTKLYFFRLAGRVVYSSCAITATIRPHYFKPRYLIKPRPKISSYDVHSSHTFNINTRGVNNSLIQTSNKAGIQLETMLCDFISSLRSNLSGFIIIL